MHDTLWNEIIAANEELKNTLIGWIIGTLKDGEKKYAFQFMPETPDAYENVVKTCNHLKEGINQGNGIADCYFMPIFGTKYANNTPKN